MLQPCVRVCFLVFSLFFKIFISFQLLLQTSQGTSSEPCSKPRQEPQWLWSANRRPIPLPASCGRKETFPSTPTTGKASFSVVNYSLEDGDLQTRSDLQLMIKKDSWCTTDVLHFFVCALVQDHTFPRWNAEARQREQVWCRQLHMLR